MDNDTFNKETEKTFSVEIISDKDSFSSSYQPIKFTPIVEGDGNKQLQYHWIIESKDDIEGFIIPENGPQKEIINSGEPVEFGIFAMVQWVEGAYGEFKVKLQVEEKGTTTIVASDEITIENHEGFYKIK